MGGILAYVGAPCDLAPLRAALAATVPPSGADNVRWIVELEDDGVMVAIGMHRRAINGVHDRRACQPFSSAQSLVACTGEIWNHPALIVECGAPVRACGHGASDCEVLPWLYRHLERVARGRAPLARSAPDAFAALCRKIDGEFGLVAYDRLSRQLFAARDRLGMRGMFYAREPPSAGEGNVGGGVVVGTVRRSVEAAAAATLRATPDEDGVHALSPGEWVGVDAAVRWPRTHDAAPYDRDHVVVGGVLRETATANAAATASYNAFCRRFCTLLVNAVRKRCMTEQPLACVLSGGDESALVAGILASLVREAVSASASASASATTQATATTSRQKAPPPPPPPAPRLRAFTVGYSEGSGSVRRARAVAARLHMDHREKLGVLAHEMAATLGAFASSFEEEEENGTRVLLLGCDDVVLGDGTVASGEHRPRHPLLCARRLACCARTMESLARCGLEGRYPLADLDLLDLALRAPAEWVSRRLFRHRAFAAYYTAPRVEKI